MNVWVALLGCVILVGILIFLADMVVLVPKFGNEKIELLYNSILFTVSAVFINSMYYLSHVILHKNKIKNEKSDFISYFGPGLFYLLTVNF